MFWALGKTNIRYKEDLSDSFREVLMDSLLNAAGDLKLFDLESIFVGLGLMQVTNILFTSTFHNMEINSFKLNWFFFHG